MADRLKELNVTKKKNNVYEDTMSVSLNLPFCCTVKLFSHGKCNYNKPIVNTVVAAFF